MQVDLNFCSLDLGGINSSKFRHTAVGGICSFNFAKTVQLERDVYSAIQDAGSSLFFDWTMGEVKFWS